MFQLPFVTELLEDDSPILMLGMGGGYDIFAATQPDRKVVLANLSFVHDLMDKRRSTQTDFGDPNLCIEAKAEDWPADAFTGNRYPANYYPELHLSRWLGQELGEPQPVYAFNLHSSPPHPVLSVAAYQTCLEALCQHYKVGTLILVDAGVDSVLKGDEDGLGTYAEDLLSLLAVRQLPLRRYLMCVGLGTEARVGEIDFLRNWAALIQNGSYLGSVGWTPKMPGVQAYASALAACVPTNTSINTIISASVEGHFGRYCPPCLQARGLSDGDMALQPFSSLCFFFAVEPLCDYRLYLDECQAATSLLDLEHRFRAARVRAGIEERGSGRYLGTKKYRALFHTPDMQ